MKGLTPEGIRAALARHPDIDEVVAIGPPLMMQACAEATRPHRIKTIVTVNPIMVDGTGMCGGCRVKVGGQVKFGCVDGPDFDGHLVDFDDLMVRLRPYTHLERAAEERFSASCRMTRAVGPSALDALAASASAAADQRELLELWEMEHDALGG